MTHRFLPVLAAVLLLTSFAAPARADVTLTPFVGSLFSGELDFGWTPSFVGATSTHNAVNEANMTGNLIVGIPIGGTHGASIRPYVVGGVGLLRATAKASDFGDPIR